MNDTTVSQVDMFSDLTAEVVSAYVSNNSVPPSEIADLIASVHTALASLDQFAASEGAGPEKPTPAQIKKSITPDALISFEDGKPYKTLRRHLGVHGLTPGQYRTKWGLPVDCPITSAGYSAQRSEMAYSFGLGRKAAAASRASEPAAGSTAKPAEDKLKTRGRPRKVKEQT